VCYDDDPLDTPFTVIFDYRERRPFRFANIRSSKRHGGKFVRVHTQPGYLMTADYSIAGLTDRIGIERKSKDDLFDTMGRGRDRFRREFERLSEMEFAAVVIESSLLEIVERPPLHSRVSAASVVNTIVSWQQRYPVHWWFTDTRRYAEIVTFRILERFYHEHVNASKTVVSSAV